MMAPTSVRRDTKRGGRDAPAPFSCRGLAPRASFYITPTRLGGYRWPPFQVHAEIGRADFVPVSSHCRQLMTLEPQSISSVTPQKPAKAPPELDLTEPRH